MARWALLVLALALLVANKPVSVFGSEDAEDAEEDARNVPVEERTHYWFNDVTSESQWNKPLYEYTDPDTDKIYFVDPDTKEASWEKPDSLQWVEVEDDEGKTYYYNEATSVSQWEKPTGLAWRKVPVDEGAPADDAKDEL